MNTNDNGGPAFPTADHKQPGDLGVSVMSITGGMTLRDYFAAKAMQAFVCRNGFSEVAAAAKAAYITADAMLEARNA